MRRLGIIACAVLAGWLLLAAPARAEYRAYELEVVDLYDCRMNKRTTCQSGRVTTALDPQQYLLTHGGDFHVGVLLLATWMCYGDTSFYKAVCPRPVARKPKFNVGDDVVIALKKHITEGWHGKVEVAYYQASVRSNVYGVRFPDRRGVYARYYEKDIEKAVAGAAPAGAGAGAAAASTQAVPGGAAANTQPASATAAGTPTPAPLAPGAATTAAPTPLAPGAATTATPAGAAPGTPGP
jgi:hypothetical protein